MMGAKSGATAGTKHADCPLAQYCDDTRSCDSCGAGCLSSHGEFAAGRAIAGKRISDLIDRRQVEVGDGEFGALPCQLVSNSGGDPASPTRNKD